jgi:hypothetical protein
MIKAGESWLDVEAPLFALPVIHGLSDDVINEVTDMIFSKLTCLVDIAAVKLVNIEHQAAYDSAFEALSIVAGQQGVASDAFKTAQTKALSDLSQFSKFNAGQ